MYISRINFYISLIVADISRIRGHMSQIQILDMYISRIVIRDMYISRICDMWPRILDMSATINDM